MALKQFKLDEAYITEVNVRQEHDYIKDRSNPTNDELILILKGYDKSVSIYNKDHEEFTKLREQLGELGYIRIERNWWNGDRVLKPFRLNEWLFKKGHKFPCAAAMEVSIRTARQLGRNTISYL